MSEREESTEARLVLHMQPILLKWAEAAKVLAISERTLQDLVAAGEIPCVNVGYGKERIARRFLVEDPLAWAKARREAGALDDDPSSRACIDAPPV
jgi:excisionase family DNA binding protein